MDIGTISVRYAKALIEYAEAHGTEDVLYREVLRLSQSFISFPKLRDTLSSPIMPFEEKLELISIAANGNHPSSETLTRFMWVVLKQHRENFLMFMCWAFISLYRKHKHIGVGTLITAVPVDKATEERIRDSAAAAVHAEMELNTIVDPSIEGGFIFDINDYRLDASIATQLKRVKQQYIEKNKRIV